MYRFEIAGRHCYTFPYPCADLDCLACPRDQPALVVPELLIGASRSYRYSVDALTAGSGPLASTGK